jgi:hypothetical protein
MSKLAGCLAGAFISLILVGQVSNTLTRHLIQIVPIIIAFAAALTKRKWAVFAAFPLFIFWLLIMIFIWLYLLKIANITRGHFTTPEIALTIVIGICCVYGIILSLARLATSRLTTVAFILWNLAIGFILIFFFNTLTRTLPGYRRNLQLALALLTGPGITLLVYFLQRPAPAFRGRNILVASASMALQAGALALSYL